jgi:hypothetical protein
MRRNFIIEILRSCWPWLKGALGSVGAWLQLPATCHGLGRLMQGINRPLSDTVACDRELSADIVPCRVSCDRVDGANSHVRAGGATEGPI